jgi:hypothetical protein
MKRMKFLRLTLLFIVIGGLTFITSCGPENNPKPSIEEKQFKLLSESTWKVTSVTYESTSDRTDEYLSPDMTLTISEDSNPDDDTYQYTASNRPDGPWPATGTWSFSSSSPATLLNRHDTGGDLLVTYSVTETKLQLTFEYAGALIPGGRTSAVAGTWKFVFEPQ